MFTRPRLLLVLVSATLVGCGGGGGGGYSGGGGGGGGGGSTGSTAVDALNTYRAACGGTALQSVTSNTYLATAATRHAGWQAIDDATQAGANLHHDEPRTNSLYTSTSLGTRIRTANGNNDITGANVYYEDIASSAGTTAITQLWNSVYHRMPMMRHQARDVGYGDMEMARTQFPSAGVPAVDEWGNNPAGNGYATLDWAGFSTPSITLSYWPMNGTTGVPPIFSSNTESPDPVSGRNQVGCPIHVIFPETAGTFSVVNITLMTGATHIPLTVLVGNASPTGPAGDVASLAQDGSGLMDPGELFAIPTPGSSGGLTPNASYTYSVSVTLNSNPYTISNVTYTTGP